MTEPDSPFLRLLRNRINLGRIPFSDRGSRLMLFRTNDHFVVRLAERWFKQDGQLSSYRSRPALLDELVLTDGDGSPLELELTTYPHRVDCMTRLGEFSLAFLDPETLILALPASVCGVRFVAQLNQAQADRRGGILRLVGEVSRSIAYTTNASQLKQEVLQPGPTTHRVNLTMDARAGGKALLLNITPRLGFNRWIPDPVASLEAAAKRWHDWFEAAPPVETVLQPQYYYAWWVMRAGLISTRFYTTREAMTPSKAHYVGVWQWDAYFHALAYRHVDMKLAKDQIRILLDHQRSDGMIPDAVHDEGTVTHLSLPIDADVTKPPLLAWTAWKLYETDGDLEFLDEIYESVVRWNKWWFEKNDSDGNGLCEYRHPYSSGLDDSPLWDEGMPVESPDLNTYLCLQQDALARMAQALGLEGEAQLWAQHSQSMADRMIRHLWDGREGMFWARRPGGGQRVLARTPFNLFPLITGRLPSAICERLVGHLTDERTFWTAYPVPTVARDDPSYDPEQMWRGPTWVNVNYLLIEGLERAGYRPLASKLRRRTLAMMLDKDDLYEYYNPETGEAPPKAASIYGWSSSLFIDMALKDTEGHK